MVILRTRFGMVNVMIILCLGLLAVLLSLIKVRKNYNLELKSVSSYTTLGELRDKKLEGREIFIICDVTFNEFEMPCKESEK